MYHHQVGHTTLLMYQPSSGSHYTTQLKAEIKYLFYSPTTKLKKKKQRVEMFEQGFGLSFPHQQKGENSKRREMREKRRGRKRKEESAAVSTHPTFLPLTQVCSLFPSPSHFFFLLAFSFFIFFSPAIRSLSRFFENIISADILKYRTVFS